MSWKVSLSITALKFRDRLTKADQKTKDQTEQTLTNPIGPVFPDMNLDSRFIKAREIYLDSRTVWVTSPKSDIFRKTSKYGRSRNFKNYKNWMGTEQVFNPRRKKYKKKIKINNRVKMKIEKILCFKFFILILNLNALEYHNSGRDSRVIPTKWFL